MQRLVGLQVRVIGASRRGISPTGGRCVFVSNHSSWLDIPVLGGVLDACFVAKDEVGRWPLIGTIARLGRTVFVSRQRHAPAGSATDARAAGGRRQPDPVPGGHHSDGSRVLPFRSRRSSPIAEGARMPPLIQPVSVVYDRLGGLPTGRASRPLFAWYGDMDLGIAFLAVRPAQRRCARRSCCTRRSTRPRFANRKALAHAVWQTVADGAAHAAAEPPGRGRCNACRRRRRAPAYA